MPGASWLGSKLTLTSQPARQPDTPPPPSPPRVRTHTSGKHNDSPLADFILCALLLLIHGLQLAALLPEGCLHLQLLLYGSISQLVPAGVDTYVIDRVCV